MQTLPINHRDKFSPLPTHEPKPNAFSAETFNEEIPPEELKNWYLTLIIFVTSWIIVGAIFATITMFALYWTAIERGNLMYETDDMIKQVQYNTDVITTKVQENANIMPKINENIEKLWSGIVEELKPKEAKIVNQ